MMLISSKQKEIHLDIHSLLHLPLDPSFQSDGDLVIGNKFYLDGSLWRKLLGGASIAA